MKHTLFTMLALISANAFALDPAIMEAEARKAPIYHPTCKIFYAPFDDKAVNKELEKVLSEKGYEPLNSVKELKKFKKGLGYMLSGEEGRARRRLEHSIRNCEKAQDNLSLNFEAGRRDENTGFFAVEVSRLAKTDCQKQNLDDEMSHEVVRNLPTDFPIPTPQPNESLNDAVANQVATVANQAFADFPSCIKQEDLTFEVTEMAPLAPPPECEEGPGCYDGQRYTNIKELQDIENRRILRMTGGARDQ